MGVKNNRNKCCPPHAAALLRWCCLIATFFCLEQLAIGSRMLGGKLVSGTTHVQLVQFGTKKEDFSSHRALIAENLLLHENARLPSSPHQARQDDGLDLEWNNGITSTLDHQGETEEVETPLANRHWKLRGRSHLVVTGATQQQSSPLYQKQVRILSRRRSLSALKQHSRQSGEKAHPPAYDLEEPTPPPYGSSSTQETTVSTSVRIPAHMNELMSMDYTPVHRKPPINNEIPYFPAHYKPNELIPSGN